MTEKMQVYVCNICGNITEVLHEGKGELVCCGEPMELMDEKTSGENSEMHIPEIETTPNGFFVNVGIIQHPMDDKHRIEWVEIQLEDDSIHRKPLTPGGRPQVYFRLDDDDIIDVRTYCNKHGLWKKP